MQKSKFQAKLQLTNSLILNRKAFVLKTSENGRKAICIDTDNAEEILEYINQDERHRKKFRYIAELILRGLKNTELYDKENIDRKAKNVTAMKFFKGQENDRIYCKEQRVDNMTYVIICCELFRSKKSKSNDKKVKEIIKKISKYNYEIEG